MTRHQQLNEIDSETYDLTAMRTMRVVAYDIAEPNRLKRVAKICELYGRRIEQSVFECDLKEELFAKFWNELTKVINHEEDAVIVYKICKSCNKDVQWLGNINRPVKEICYFAG